MATYVNRAFLNFHTNKPLMSSSRSAELPVERDQPHTLLGPGNSSPPLSLVLQEKDLVAFQKIKRSFGWHSCSRWTWDETWWQKRRGSLILTMRFVNSWPVRWRRLKVRCLFKSKPLGGCAEQTTGSSRDYVFLWLLPVTFLTEVSNLIYSAQ